MIEEMAKCEQDREEAVFLPDLSQKYEDRLSALAQLACIDGALILSSTLEVISFGATLMATKWTGEVKVGQDGLGGGGEIFNNLRLGTRHNSAIDYIGACPGTIGFVVSEDGPIRGLVRGAGQTVLCWPDCRVSTVS